MAVWILVISSYYGGVSHIEMTSHKACIEARQEIKANISSLDKPDLICIKK